MVFIKHQGHKGPLQAAAPHSFREVFLARQRAKLTSALCYTEQHVTLNLPSPTQSCLISSSKASAAKAVCEHL